MAITEGFTMLENMMNNLTVFNIDFIIPLIVATFMCLIISRDNWGVVFFPSIILTQIMGMRPNILLIIIGAIIFVISALSLYQGGSLKPVVNKTKEKPSFANKHLTRDVQDLKKALLKQYKK